MKIRGEVPEGSGTDTLKVPVQRPCELADGLGGEDVW